MSDGQRVFTDEELVRSVWDNVRSRHWGGHQELEDGWKIEARLPDDILCIGADPEEAGAWKAALEFTCDRLEEIRKLEIDIDWMHIDEDRDYENLQGCVNGRELHAFGWLPQFATRNIVRRTRIIGRMGAELARLTRGIRNQK